MSSPSCPWEVGLSTIWIMPFMDYWDNVISIVSMGGRPHHPAFQRHNWMLCMALQTCRKLDVRSLQQMGL